MQFLPAWLCATYVGLLLVQPDSLSFTMEYASEWNADLAFWLLSLAEDQGQTSTQMTKSRGRVRLVPPLTGKKAKLTVEFKRWRSHLWPEKSVMVEEPFKLHLGEWTHVSIRVAQRSRAGHTEWLNHVTKAYALWGGWDGRLAQRIVHHSLSGRTYSRIVDCARSWKSLDTSV